MALEHYNALDVFSFTQFENGTSVKSEESPVERKWNKYEIPVFNKPLSIAKT